MPVEKAPFTTYRTEEERTEDKGKVFTIRLNREEVKALDEAKLILQQPKDSTAVKQLAEIGLNVLHDDLLGHVIKTLFNNKRRNRRTGIMLE